MIVKGESGQSHANGVYAIGLDIGGTNLKGGLVDSLGQLQIALSEATPRTPQGFQEVAEAFYAKLSPNVPIRAIGIGCKGVLDIKSTEVLFSPGDLKHLEGHRLRDLLGAGAAGKPVFADNDARTALIAEWLWGAAKGFQNVLMLTLGTGVGGAMLMQGQIVRGAHGAAGHIGHMTINPYGPMCICGNYGCLETVFSARSIEAEAFSAAHRRVHSVLTDRGAMSDCSQVFQAAAESDEVAGWIIDRATRHLGAALASLVHLVDPELIILGGQIAEAGAQLLDPLREELRRRTRFIIGRDLPIVSPRVPSHTGVIGAAGLALLETGALRG
ncbi:MAG TPA: ROK family protein [Verrucomicrobiae bacterium]|nr:ROK family protein [Verrucomicrobiae bacterium]